MAKHDTWMPIYLGDYLKDTTNLQAEQHGAYLLLMMAAWCRGGHVPDDPEELANIARVPLDRWHSHTAAKVLPFWSHRDGLYWHDRLCEELDRARTNVEQKSKAGAAGAAARWQKDGTRITDALPKQRQNYAPSPSPSPISNPGGLDTPLPPDPFAEAWALYPKRPGNSKAAALKAWNARVKAGVSTEVMVDAVRRYAAYVLACKTEPQFVKHAATFFGPGDHHLADWTPPAPGQGGRTPFMSQKDLDRKRTAEEILAHTRPTNGHDHDHHDLPPVDAYDVESRFIPDAP